MAHSHKSRPAQRLSVYRAEMLRVVNGANLGDPLGFADELIPDDIYRLSPLAVTTPLSVITSAQPPFRITHDSETGTPKADLHLDCCLTFMSGDGQTTECLVLVEVDDTGHAAQVYILPLAPLTQKSDYVLVGVDRDSAMQRFAQVACMSFTGGTMITMATGAQRAVQDLQVGDRVLTRDDGPQEIRWIGYHTARAVGSFAPIRIQAGALNNTNDLLVSPDHRLFIYQRVDELGAGRAEVLVRARHLINGTTVAPVTGGFVDYYQMFFDAHQIIYAEGIAAESMLVETSTRAALPEEIGDKLAELIPGHRKTDHGDLEVQQGLLDRPDAADILRKSSAG